MRMNRRYTIIQIILAVVTAVAIVSCHNVDLHFNPHYDKTDTREEINRLPSTEYRNVLILYFMGYNNLHSFLRRDIEELTANAHIGNPRDRILIFSHLCNHGNYKIPTSPMLREISTDVFGNIICDTLEVYPDTLIGADTKTVNTILSDIKEKFPADNYGILFSSHGTGWAPEDYCNSPNKYDPTASDDNIWSVRRKEDVVPKPAWIYPETDEVPMVKSMGVHNISSNKFKEMDISALADAIPMKTKYLIFDACFMGGVEVAYEFKDVCDRFVGSQTEIIADGMDYITMTSFLLNNIEADLEGFCRNYFNFYRNHSDPTCRSATISLISTEKLDFLADVCKEIFESQRDGIAALEGSDIVQGYYQRRYADYHKWFHDLESIVINCGASEEQIARFKDALASCVEYKAATPSFFGSEITIKHHCGLSMYLPFKDRPYLNEFYKTLEWNKATGLVR